jgi:hypothetical protein
VEELFQGGSTLEAVNHDRSLGPHSRERNPSTPVGTDTFG